jgi:hypothetical protein
MQPSESTEHLLNLFDRPKLIGLVGDAGTGKSNLLYYVVKTLREQYTFNLYSYGLRLSLGEQKIYSVEELERIHDSVVLIDEFTSMFDVDDRKEKRQIENTLRMIFHNNNVVLLSGLPENYKKFIAAKLDAMVFTRCALSDFINGSRDKKVALNYRGPELGAAVLNVELSRAIVYDGTHYHSVEIPYMESFDTKKDNVSILVPKNAEKTSVKNSKKGQ